MHGIRTGTADAVSSLTDNSGGAAADGTIAAIAAPTAMTDGTAGTADGTLEVLPNPADTPITADQLRDDVTVNILPVLRNWAADLAARQSENRAAIVALTDAVKELAAKQNAILAALRAAGLLSS